MKTKLIIATILYFLISTKFVSARSRYSAKSEEDNDEDESNELDSGEDEFKADIDDVMSVIGSMFSTRLKKEGKILIYQISTRFL
jgi:peptidoglycan hydrolase CwlO-like protein